MKPITISIKKFCKISGFGRSTAFMLIREGKIEAVRNGRRKTLVTYASVERLLTPKDKKTDRSSAEADNPEDCFGPEVESSVDPEDIARLKARFEMESQYQATDGDRVSRGLITFDEAGCRYRIDTLDVEVLTDYSVLRHEMIDEEKFVYRDECDEFFRYSGPQVAQSREAEA